MHRIFIKLMAAALLMQGAAFAYANDVHVGVSVSGEITPGVYGQVDIGNTPPPVVYTQPVYAIRPARPVAVTPVYLHVPPGHAKHWSKHCHRYNACRQPVYFVKSREYEPDRHHHHREKHHRGRHHD